jgi:hypothetical protein
MCIGLLLLLLNFASFRRFFKNHVPFSPDYSSIGHSRKKIDKSINIILVLILSFTKNFWKVAYLQKS